MIVEYFCVKESCVHYWVSTSGRLQRRRRRRRRRRGRMVRSRRRRRRRRRRGTPCEE